MSEETPIKDLSFRVHDTMLPVADQDRSTVYTRLLGMKLRSAMVYRMTEHRMGMAQKWFD